MTISEQIFVFQRGLSKMFYGDTTKPMLTAISQAKLPVKLLIYIEGQTASTFFSVIGSTSALDWHHRLALWRRYE